MTEPPPPVERPDRDPLEEALVGLRGLDQRPTAEHVRAFERVHAAMSDALAAIDGA
jgi:hypothetical protein